MMLLSQLLNSHWLVPTVCATGCWALSDVCCDCAIASAEDDADAAEGTNNDCANAVRNENRLFSAWSSIWSFFASVPDGCFVSFDHLSLSRERERASLVAMTRESICSRFGFLCGSIV